MQTPRADACSSVLTDDRVLVAGGSDASGAIRTVELYRADGTFAAASPLHNARAGAACATLADGRVLVVGGSDGGTVLNSAEIFDPARDTWTPASAMAAGRTGHRAVLMPWGAVLICGGRNSDTVTNTIELYLPQTDRFQTVGRLSSLRTDYAIALLPGRRILIAGGTDGKNTLSTVEIYDATTGSVLPAGEMLQARKNFAAAALLDGRVLIAGGTGDDGNPLDSTEILDSADQSSVIGPTLALARANLLAHTLPNNGAVLLAGGFGSDGVLSSAELYVPATGTLKQGAPMSFPRIAAASGLRRPGSLVVAGGKNGSGFLASSELYRFATIQTDKSDYAPGESAVITGSGWQPGEQVLISVAAFPLDNHRVEFTSAAAADGNGNVHLEGFKIDRSHLGTGFLMTASGTESLAQSLFADAEGTQIDSAVPFTPASPAVFGTSVDLKGTIVDTDTPANIPTGTVTITVNEVAIPNGTVVLLGTGAFDFHFDGTSQFLQGGVNSISIVYNGDKSHSASPPKVLTFTMTPANIPWSIVMSPALPNPLQSVNITVSANAIGGTELRGGVRLCQAAVCPWIVAQAQVPAYASLQQLSSIGSGSSAVSSFTFTLPNGLPFGTYGIQVSYETLVLVNGLPNILLSHQMAANFQNAVSSVTNIIVPDTTTVTLTTNPVGSAEFTQPATYTATVADTVTPATGASGTVDFFDNGSKLATVVVCAKTLVSCAGKPNQAQFTNSAMTFGAHSLSATYNGYAATLASTSPTVSFNVTSASTITGAAVTSLANAAISTSVWGQQVVLKAIVASQSPAIGTPGSGPVQFFDGGSPIGLPVTVSAGAATLTIAPSSLGAHSYTAQYLGNGAGYAASTVSAAVSLTVNQASTTVSTPVLTSGTPVFGNPITLSASVMPAAPGAGTPTGTITFKDGVTTLGIGTRNGSGAAILSTSTLTVGSHSITAVYAGDVNFTGATSSALSPSIGNVSTTTSTPVLTGGTPIYGKQLTFSATVTSAGGTPTGTITFFDGVSSIGSGTLNGPGTGAVTTVGFLISGPHSITATYNSDTNFATSTSAALTQNVAKAATSISLPVLSSGTPAYGNTVTFSATVTSTAGTPTGMITFFDGATGTGSATLNGAGTASVTISTLNAGSHSITASFGGDTDFATSTSAALSQSIAKANSNVTVTSSTLSALPLGQTLVYGQTVVFSAAFTSAGTTPSGTANLVDSATSNGLCSGTITAGTATCTAVGGIAGLSVAAHSISVNFSGDTNYSLGTVTPLSFMIAKAATSVSTPVLANGSPNVGQSLTFSVTVAVVVRGSGTPSGPVTFSDGSTAIGTGAVNAAGVASITIATLTAGSHSIRAAYGGDGNFLASASGQLAQSTSKALTSVSTPVLSGGSATPNSSMTYSSTVTAVSGAGAPTGTITFTADGRAQTAVVINPGGTASLTVTFPAGSHTVAAAYSGDPNFQASTSSTLTQSVNNPASTSETNLNVTLDTNAPTVGQKVTFTVGVVSDSSDVPLTGTVQFFDGTTLLGSAQVIGGQATLTIVFNPAGSHNMMVRYSGDGSNRDASKIFAVTVTRIPLTLNLTSNLSTSVYGQPVTLTAKVTSQTPTGVSLPSGSVQFLEGATVVATGTFTQGVAVVKLINLDAGAHQIIASFPGDPNWFNSKTTAVPQLIAKAQTALTLGALPDVSGSTQQVTVTANVGVAAPGGGIPSGIVQFVDAANNTVLGSVQVVGGAATANFTEPAGGARVINAIYSGTPNYVDSKSAAVTHISLANAAGYNAFHASPDEIMSIFGANLADGAASATSVPLPSSLAGTTVKITDQAGMDHQATLYFAAPTQINLLVPADVPLGPVEITVTNSKGDSFPILTAATSTAPGLFTANADGRGIAAAQVIRISSTGQTVENVAQWDQAQSIFVPAPISFFSDQLVLTLYGTGIRHTGGQSSVTCTINGQVVPILFAGAQPTFAGLDQVNLQLPASLAGSGLAAVFIQVDGQATNSVNLMFQ